MNAVRFGSYSSRSTFAGDVELAPLEVDHAVGLLVAAAAEAHRDAAVIVAAAARMLAFGQRLDRLALVERRAIDQHQLALARRGRDCKF